MISYHTVLFMFYFLNIVMFSHAKFFFLAEERQQKAQLKIDFNYAN